MARKVTLQTIAEHLGVSRTTVSNAYNRPDQLAPELRERVLATAAELGYPGPDPAARRLRSGGREAIGLLFTESLAYAFNDPGAVLFLQGFSRATEEAGLALLLLPGFAGRRARPIAAASARRPCARPSSPASAPTRCPSTTPTSRPRSSGACRSWSSTSRARASTPSSASTTARARGWPPGTSRRSGTAASGSSPSAPPTTATAAR